MWGINTRANQTYQHSKKNRFNLTHGKSQLQFVIPPFRRTAVLLLGLTGRTVPVEITSAGSWVLRGRLAAGVFPAGAHPRR